MTTIFRYITREIMSVFVIVFFLMILTGLIGRFVGFLQDAVTGRYAADIIWVLIALKAPEFVQIIAPLALFVALVITYGRLHADTEYVVLSVGGISPRRMISWLLGILIPFAVFIAYLSLQVTPTAGRAFVDLSLEQRINSEFDALTEGTFRDFSDGSRVTYADLVNSETKHLSGVFIGEIVDEKVTSLWARGADYYRDSLTGSRFLLLENGNRYEGLPGSKSYRVLSFEKLGQRLEVEPIQNPVNDTRIQPTESLSFQDGTGAAELHWRLSIPVLTIISGLLAFGLAKVRPRSGRFGRLMPALGLFLSYYVSLLLLKNLIPKSELLYVVGMWPAHILMFILAIWLIKRISRPI